MKKNPIVGWKRYQWLHFDSPLSDENVSWLQKKFGFTELDLEDCKEDINQRPKWEMHDDYSFFIFNFVELDRQNKLVVRDLKVFVGESFLITQAYGDSLVKGWFESSKKSLDKELFESTPGYLLYKLLDRYTDKGLLTVRKMGLMFNRVDEEMNSFEKRAINDISKLRRNLVVYITILNPMIRIMKQLENTKIKFLNTTLNSYWGSIGDHLKQSYDTLQDYSELLEGLTKSFDILVTQKTNYTVQVLTIFSVLFLPLTLLSGIYGMNVKLPLADSPNAFLLIILLMLLTLLLMLGIFKYKKWV